MTLEELNKLAVECDIKDEVIIVGDTNAHFGQGNGVRFWGKSTRNGRMLFDFVHNNNLILIDSDPNKCIGPNYTFYVENVGKSYIDHCITSSSIAEMVKCVILEDCIMNTSDHLPLICVADIDNLDVDINYFECNRIMWCKLTPAELDNYRKETEIQCQNIVAELIL